MFIGMVSFFVWNTCGSRMKENEKGKNIYFKIYVVSANNLTNFISFVFLNSCASAVMKSQLSLSAKIITNKISSRSHKNYKCNPKDTNCLYSARKNLFSSYNPSYPFPQRYLT